MQWCSGLLPGWRSTIQQPDNRSELYACHQPTQRGHQRMNHLAGPDGDAPLLLLLLLLPPLLLLGCPSASAWLLRLPVLRLAAMLVRDRVPPVLVARCAAVVLESPAALRLPSTFWVLPALLLRCSGRCLAWPLAELATFLVGRVAAAGGAAPSSPLASLAAKSDNG
jgi:hypothetical protein